MSASDESPFASPPEGSPTPLDSIELHLDRELYERMVEDMERHADAQAPADLWKPANLFPDSEKKQTSPTFQDLVAPWIGQAAKAHAPPDLIRSCMAFLESHGAEPGGAELGPTPTKSDLRTLLDLALIRKHASQVQPLRILEIGGGYGRLAEGFLRLGSPAVRYLMVDAVPASLYYAYAYVRQRLPDREVGLYYLDPGPDVARYDYYVAPVWHLDRLELPPFDVGVNIASMQEMRRDQVDWYLGLLDRLLREGGIIYLSNTRDYAYGHEYDFPHHWRLLFKENTPLSWSPHYPVEILSKDVRDWSLENASREAAYLRGVCATYRDQIRDLRSQHRETVARLREALTARASANARLKQRNEELRQALAARRKRAEER